jgi:hypothetical protein
MSSFEAILAAWERGGATEQNILRRQLPGACWSEACRHAVKLRQVEEVERWLRGEGPRGEVLACVRDLRVGDLTDLGKFYAAQMTAYLLSVQAALAGSPDVARRQVGHAALAADLPEGFYRDLIAGWRQQPLEAVATQPIGALLVEGGDKGILVTLRFERIDRGAGELYLTPAARFLYRDAGFRRAERCAADYVRSRPGLWNDDTDVRWSIAGGAGDPSSLLDESVGGAFAAGLQFLLSEPCDLRPYVVCARVAADGRLGGIEECGWKLKYAAALNAGGAVRGLVAAEDQQGAAAADGLPDCRRADSVEDAVRQLQAMRARDDDRRSRRGGRSAPGQRHLAAGGDAIHHYEVKAGGRVVVVLGAPGSAPSDCEIDTGLIQSDFFADRLFMLTDRPCQEHSRAGGGWVRELADALPPSPVRARMLQRLGDRPAALALLRALLASADQPGRVQAARALAELDPGQVSAAVNALFPLLNAPDQTGGYVLPQVAEALVRIDPRQAQAVVPVMQALIRNDPNNFVRVLAIRALAAADAACVPAAIQWLEALLPDPNNLLRLRAVLALWEIAPGCQEMALEIARPLIWDPNGEVRRAVFNLLMAIAARSPEAVANLSWPWDYIAYRFVTAGTAQALRELALADSLPALAQAFEKIDDLFLKERQDVEDYTHAIAAKLATILHPPLGEECEPAAAVDFLSSEIRRPSADRWAIYRHGCALAIPRCIPPEQRPASAARLQALWQQEAQPHLRIAWAMALEGTQ